MKFIVLQYNDNTVHSVSLAVSIVLSTLAFSVLLPSSESVSTYRICATANNKCPYWQARDQGQFEILDSIFT